MKHIEFPVVHNGVSCQEGLTIRVAIGRNHEMGSFAGKKGFAQN